MSLILLLALLSPEVAADPGVSGDGYLVIVHVAHESDSIPQADLAAVFLGRAKAWKDRTAIESVDQSLSSRVRESFSRDVLNLEPRALLQYWQSQIQQRSGRRPPIVKDHDAAVVAWVGERPGRIGYVTPGTDLDDSVKVLRVTRTDGSDGAAP